MWQSCPLHITSPSGQLATCIASASSLAKCLRELLLVSGSASRVPGLPSGPPRFKQGQLALAEAEALLVLVGTRSGFES